MLVLLKAKRELSSQKNSSHTEKQNGVSNKIPLPLSALHKRLTLSVSSNPETGTVGTSGVG